ncbi:AAA family ATPase [Streptomyces sp. NPDC059957]|uniref:AAA family ATPase n=1 Tax=Streptomyces sp. NPDC059957 TaxID=3347016 RepID=UPI00365EE016
MRDNSFVILTGLPASGKSTVARGRAAELDLPVIDKDVILESLYDSLGVGDHAWRHRLSRAADDILFALAADAALVAERFRTRKRHPGHLDQDLTLKQIHDRVSAWASHPGPLDLGGPVRTIDTSHQVDINSLAREIRVLLSHTPLTEQTRAARSAAPGPAGHPPAPAHGRG